MEKSKLIMPDTKIVYCQFPLEFGRSKTKAYAYLYTGKVEKGYRAAVLAPNFDKPGQEVLRTLDVVNVQPYHPFPLDLRGIKLKWILVAYDKRQSAEDWLNDIRGMLK